MSSPHNRRLLCPATAKEMAASKCSCRSPAEPGALVGASLTCGSDAIPVLLRPRALSHGTSRCFVPASSPCNTRCLGALRTGGMSAEARTTWNHGCGPFFLQSAEPCADPPTSPFIAAGSSGCQGRKLSSTAVHQFEAARHFSPAKRFRVLLPHCSPNKLMNFACLSKLQSMF